MVKRLFDIIFSVTGIVLLSPVLIVISFIVLFTSKGGIFYRQLRVGKDFKPFKVFKFRTMYVDSDKKGSLTVGLRDNRITPFGYYLRKYKLDELPQLFNVAAGTMSFVGPRPEVPEYVALYNSEQKEVLKVKPGITDYASIAYFNENELLIHSDNPEETYIQQVMPAKLKLNLKYINDRSLIKDVIIIFKTIKTILNH